MNKKERSLRNQEILKLRQENGHSADEIATIIGCSLKTVYRILAENTPASPAIKKKHNRVIELYEEGNSLAAIAAKTGYSLDTVSLILKKIKEKQRTKKEEEVIRLSKLGHNISDIARIMNLSSYFIKTVLQEHGLYPSKTSCPQDILRLKQLGYSRKRISSISGYSLPHIDRIIRENQPISVSYIEVVQLYKDGRTKEEIAKEFGRSTSWVYESLQKAGVIEPDLAPATKMLYDKVLRLYDNGYELADIADQVGFSIAYVRKILNRRR